MIRMWNLVFLLGATLHGASIEVPPRLEKSDWMLYRAKTELNLTPLATEAAFVSDSTLANRSFLIQENGEELKITIHSFPYENFKDRIPPPAQIARWKRQIRTRAGSPVIVEPKSHGGFSGLYLEMDGEMEGQGVKVLAWAMQLAPEHYRTLVYQEDRDWNDRIQLASDYTIKVTGSPGLVEKYKQELKDFARSLELIEEIPSVW